MDGLTFQTLLYLLCGPLPPLPAPLLVAPQQTVAAVGLAQSTSGTVEVVEHLWQQCSSAVQQCSAAVQ